MANPEVPSDLVRAKKEKVMESKFKKEKKQHVIQEKQRQQQKIERSLKDKPPITPKRPV
ncbi:hypothetical protein KKH43_03700 [Patescibacteria group bacterium]|nr:hypothetical protein [Patescibacteria group bacterium]